MATSSRLKTLNGKYYATEDYVKKFVDENLEESIASGNINNAISGAISEVTPKIENLQQAVNNFFTMNTL